MAELQRANFRPPSKSALFEAAQRWDVARVKWMVGVAPELVRAPDFKGRLATHLACAVKPGREGLGEPTGIQTVNALLAAGADLEAAVPMDPDEGDFRATPLWYAISRGRNLHLARFLLKRGADASYALWTVVFQDDAVACRELLKTRPRLNVQAHGETPIYTAARLQRLKTLELLIRAGADPTIPGPRGLDAVEIARARRLPGVIIAHMEELKRRIERRASRG